MHDIFAKSLLELAVCGCYQALFQQAPATMEEQRRLRTLRRIYQFIFGLLLLKKFQNRHVNFLVVLNFLEAKLDYDPVLHSLSHGCTIFFIYI